MKHNPFGLAFQKIKIYFTSRNIQQSFSENSEPSKQIVFMAYRATENNFFFPDTLIIDETKITYLKNKIIGFDSIVISLKNIASVHSDVGLLFGKITIESNGGNDNIIGTGFLKSDLQKIQKLIDM